MPRPRLKRLLRISLRMVFVLTTILCIWLGYTVHQVKQQKEAIAWVKVHRGYVVYDYQATWIGNDFQYTGNAEPPGPKWLHDLIGVDYFVTPMEVDLLFADGPDDLSPLANLPGLTRLIVRSTAVRDLSPLAKLQELKLLGLDCREVNDLAPLSKLTKLKVLMLPASTTNEEIAKLAEILPDWQMIVASLPSE